MSDVHEHENLKYCIIFEDPYSKDKTKLLSWQSYDLIPSNVLRKRGRGITKLSYRYSVIQWTSTCNSLFTWPFMFLIVAYDDVCENKASKSSKLCLFFIWSWRMCTFRHLTSLSGPNLPLKRSIRQAQNGVLAIDLTLYFSNTITILSLLCSFCKIIS